MFPVEVISVVEDSWELLMCFPVEVAPGDSVSELLPVDELFFEVLLGEPVEEFSLELSGIDLPVAIDMVDGDL